MTYYLCTYSDYTDLPSKLFPDHTEIYVRESHDGLRFWVRSDTDTPGNGVLDWMSGSEPSFTHTEHITELKRLCWAAVSNRSKEIGVIYSQSLMTLDDFTQGGTGDFTEVTGGVQMSHGGFTDWNQQLLFNENGNAHKITCLEKWKIRCKITTDDYFDGASSGIGFGIKSTHYNEEVGHVARIVLDTNGGNILGSMVVYEGEKFTSPDAVVVSPPYALTPETEYTFELELDGFNITHRVYDSDDVLLLERSYDFDMDTTGLKLPNTGQFAIYSFGGTRLIQDIEISTKTKKNIDVLLVGDSNGRGFFAEAVENRWFDIFMTDNYPLMTYENISGFGDTVTNEVSSRVAEIIAINPRYVVLSLLSNDVNKGIAQAIRRTAYDLLITDLEAAGIIVVLTTIVPAPWDVSADSTWIAGKSDDHTIIDLYTALIGAGTGLNPTYEVSGHINIAGNAAAAAQATLDWTI